MNKEQFFYHSSDQSGKPDKQMQLLLKETGEQIVLNKGPTVSTKEKNRTEEAKFKGPAVSHQRWGE